MSDSLSVIGFGAPSEFGAHVFRVEIPSGTSEAIRIIEDFGLKGGEQGLPYEEVRATLPRTIWSAINDVARRDFNERLKTKKLPSARWMLGKNLMDRLLGKELCVLAWAAERAEAGEIPVICSQWGALRPEERWWLFSMTVVQGGRDEDKDRGWRKALYYALSDGERSPQHSSSKRKTSKTKETPPLLRLMGELSE